MVRNQSNDCAKCSSPPYCTTSTLHYRTCRRQWRVGRLAESRPGASTDAVSAAPFGWSTSTRSRRNGWLTLPMCASITKSKPDHRLLPLRRRQNGRVRARTSAQRQRHCDLRLYRAPRSTRQRRRSPSDEQRTGALESTAIGGFPRSKPNYTLCTRRPERFGRLAR